MNHLNLEKWLNVLQARRARGIDEEGTSELFETLFTHVCRLEARCEELQENIDRLERRSGT
jgi:hypothetical protein